MVSCGFVLGGGPSSRVHFGALVRPRVGVEFVVEKRRVAVVRAVASSPTSTTSTGSVDQSTTGNTEKMSVLLPEKLSEEGIDILKEQYEVKLNYDLTPEQLLEEIKNYEGIIVRSGTKVTKEVIAAGKKLKVIGRAGVGVDNIDLKAATEAGILVVNAPTGNCIAAAEHAVALICGLSRCLGAADRTLKAGGWDRSKFVGVSLVGKTIGVVGLGRIGREVAKRCLGLGMHVAAHDPYTSDVAAASLGVNLMPLEALCKEVDFITLHLPLTDGTRDLIDSEMIAHMKPSVRIINAARGGVVNEEALLEALDSGRVAGAGLDCFVNEPPNKNLDSTSYRLSVHPNVLATPHLGASTKEAQEDVAIEVATNVRNAMNGELVPTMVNAPSISKETLKTLLPRALLSERLGRLAMGLAGASAGGEVTIKYHFSEAVDTRLLRAGLIKGIMQPGTDMQITIVNADGVARKQGLMITEVMVDHDEESENYISVDFKGAPLVEGRVISGQPTVTRIGHFQPDLKLEGYLLMYVHDDKPGQIGKAGTFLGERGLNISFMTISRGVAGIRSLVLTGLDAKPSKDVLDGIYEMVGHPEMPPVLVDFS